MSNNSSRQSTSFFLRIATLFVGGYCNFSIANLLLGESDKGIFIVFSLITSIPSLIPFADFGLGSIVFNILADSKDTAEDAKKINRITSVVFVLLCFISLLLILIVIAITVITHWEAFTNNSSSTSLQYIFLLAFVFTISAVPFSLGARKLQAEYHINTVLLLQGIIPIITFIGIYSLDSLVGEIKTAFFLIPSVAYLVTTIILFQKSKISKHLGEFSIKWIPLEIKNIASIGFWSLIFSSMISYLWQLPRLIMNTNSETELLVRYSLMLLVLNPVISILSTITAWIGPRARRLMWNHEKKKFLFSRLMPSMALVLFLTLLVYLGFFVAKRINYQYPDLRELGIIAFVGTVSVFWIIPSAALTDKEDFRWMASRLAVIFIPLSCLNFINGFQSISEVLFYYFLPILSSIAALAWFRVKKLSEN